MKHEDLPSWLEGRTVVFVGDSLTAERKANYVTLTLDLLSKRIDMTNVHVLNSGVDSSSILDALDRIPELVEENNPDVFVIFIGINDSKILHFVERPLVEPAQFRSAYDALLKRIDVSRRRDKIVVTLPGLLFEEIRTGDYLAGYWYWDEHLYAEYNEVICDLAKVHQCQVADVAGAFRRQSKRRLYIEDGVHPNIYGHQLIAEEVVAALERLR